MTLETESRFEDKLQEETQIKQIKSTGDTEITRLLNEVDRLKKVIKNKNLEIETLENARMKLLRDLTRHKESLIATQKENEVLEEKINEEVSLRDTFKIECENQRVMLNGVEEKLKDTEVIHSKKLHEEWNTSEQERTAAEEYLYKYI